MFTKVIETLMDVIAIVTGQPHGPIHPPRSI